LTHSVDLDSCSQLLEIKLFTGGATFMRL